MLIKGRPPQFTDFVENKYRHEHVMIINLYTVSHILYDRHLYECILWGFCACLKEAWGCTPPLVEYEHCQCSTNKCSNSGNVAAGKGYDHVSAVLEHTRGGQSEMDLDPKGQSRGYEMTSLQTVPWHIAGMLALPCWKRKLFLTV